MAYECTVCGEECQKSDMKADHIEPVVDPVAGFVDWNTYIDRLFVESDGFQAICNECHKLKTSKENKER